MNLLLSSLDVTIHSILYQRSVYPRHLFRTSTLRGIVSYQQSSKRRVRAYAADLLSSLEPYVQQGRFRGIIISIIECAGGIPSPDRILEQYMLRITAYDLNRLQRLESTLTFETALHEYVSKLNLFEFPTASLPSSEVSFRISMISTRSGGRILRDGTDTSSQSGEWFVSRGTDTSSGGDDVVMLDDDVDYEVRLISGVRVEGLILQLFCRT